MKPSDIRLLVGIPCYGGLVRVETMTTIAQLMVGASKAGMRVTLKTIAGESLIQRARNDIAESFWQSDCTHLYFLDADLKIEPSDIVKLALHDKPICAAAYPLKRLDPVGYAFEIWSDEHGNAHFQGDLVRAKNVGTGSLMIRRDAISQIRHAYRHELRYVSDGGEHKGREMYDLFECSRIDEPGHGRRLLSEDYAFLWRWRQIGGEVWVDTTIRLTHYGQHGFEAPSLKEYFGVKT